MHLPVSISNEVSAHFAPHIEENPFDYICVYGSSVYSPDKVSSDVDLFAVTHGLGKLAIAPLVDFIRDLHARHGRHLDEEVPYHNKVHYQFSEIEAALQFSGFEVNGPDIIVPAVRKEAAFLNSPAIKARLALNGLTTPHAVIGKNFSKYHLTRERAGDAVTLLAISLLKQEEFDIQSLHNALVVSESGASGEMFLGYKTEYDLVSEHLRGVLSGALDRLAKHGAVNPTSQGHMVNWQTFDPRGYMQATADPNK